jgi:hypothetical protein
MDIQKMYGVSDAQLQLQNIGREREERETARARNMQYGTKTLMSGIKGYKTEQQLQAKELKSHRIGEESVYQTSVKHTDKPWYDPGKFFAKGEDMVEYTSEFTGKLDQIKELKGLQQIQTLGADELAKLTELESQVSPFLKDPAVGMSQKIKNLFGAQSATTTGSTTTGSTLGSKVGGGVSALTAGMEIGSKGFSKKSSGYKGMTGAQLATGLLSFVPGMQWMSLVSGGLGAGKGFMK